MTLMYMNNVGTILIHTDPQEAEQVLLKTIEKMEVHLDEKHPHRLSAYHNLGSLYFNKKQYDKADPLLLKSLEGRRVVLIDKHPERIHTISYLGKSKLAQKKYDDAEGYFREILKVQGKVEAKNTFVLAARRCTALCLVTKNQLQEAEALLQENIKILANEKTNPAEWKDTRTALAALYDKQGKKAEADALRK